MVARITAPEMDFESLPNVGPATAEDLRRLKITTLAKLKRSKPIEMYEKISAMDGEKHDICALDVFTALVEYAKTGVSKPWWHYSHLRKAAALSAGKNKKKR